MSGESSDGSSLEEAYSDVGASPSSTPDSSNPDPTSSSTPTSTSSPTPTATASSSPTASTGQVAKVSLSSSASPVAGTCFAITASGIDASGNLVNSDADVTFSLSKVAGSGSFYSTSYCGGGTTITSKTLPLGSSSVTVYYKTSTPESTNLVATYHAVTGTAYTTTVYGPIVYSLTDTHIGNTACQAYVINLRDQTSTLMTESSTDPTTLTITQTSGTPWVSFYDTQANCSAHGGTGLYTDNSTHVTTLTIAAGQTSVTAYIYSGGSGGTWVFSGAYSCTTSSTGVTTSRSGLTLTITVF